MARAARGLARLRIHNGAGESVLGRTSAAGVVQQARNPVPFVAVQPGPHHIAAARMDHCDLRHRVAAIREQDHVRPQRHSPGGLSAHGFQLSPLGIAHVHM